MEKLNYGKSLHRQIKERREDRQIRIRNDIHLYGDAVLDSDEMRAAFDQQHHKWSTVGEHTIRVALTSVLICYVLRKLHIKVSIPAVVIGSLCHDLGIIGRSEKYANNRECLIGHPKDSVEIARELVDELPEKTEAIIERHMWPIGPAKRPNSIEGAVVSVADKYASIKDIIL